MRQYVHQTDSVFASGELNIKLRERLEAFLYILRSIAYLTKEPPDYMQATQTLELLLQNSTWGQTQQSGQEVLYHFLGSAYLGMALSTSDADKSSNQLVKSRDAYLQAIALNANYARVYNGLGSVYYYQALQTDARGCNAAAQGLLTQATGAYRQALQTVPAATTDNSVSFALLEYRVRYHLATVDLVQGFCATRAKDARRAMQFHEAAAQNYQWILSESELSSQVVPSQARIAIYASGGLGKIALNRACNLPPTSNEDTETVALSEASKHYEATFDLIYQTMTHSTVGYGLEIMPEYLAALCKTKQRNRAIETLDQFVVTIAHSQAASSETTIQQDITNRVNMCGIQWKECQ